MCFDKCFVKVGLTTAWSAKQVTHKTTYEFI